MALEIHYFAQTDTLYIGGSETANEGYDIAENLIAHATDDGEIVGITWNTQPNLRSISQ